MSTIHADKASAIPYRLYSLMETDLDVDQFLNTIYRYIQLGVHIKAYYSKKYGKFHREVDEVTEFYVDENNKCQTHTIYRKMFDKNPIMVKPSAHLIEYLENQNIDISSITSKLSDKPFEEELESEKKLEKNDNNNNTVESNSSSNEDMKQNESTPDGNTIFPSDISTNKAIISNEIKKDNDTLPLQTNLSSIMPNLQSNEVKSSTPNLENSNNIDSPLQSSDATKDFSFTGKDLFTNNQSQQVVEPKVDNSINQMMGQQNNVNLDMNNIFDGMEKEEQQAPQKPENQPPGVINTIDINSLLNDSNV